MDPVTNMVVTGLIANSKTLAELVLTISDKSKKANLEAASTNRSSQSTARNGRQGAWTI